MATQVGWRASKVKAVLRSFERLAETRPLWLDAIVSRGTLRGDPGNVVQRGRLVEAHARLVADGATTTFCRAWNPYFHLSAKSPIAAQQTTDAAQPTFELDPPAIAATGSGATRLEVPGHASPLVNTWGSGGGYAAAHVRLDGLGGDGAGRIWEREGDTRLQVIAPSGGNDADLLFARSFNSGEGAWRTNGAPIQFGTAFAVEVAYDDTSTANVPVIRINGVEQALITVTAPSGTATTLAGAPLVLLNRVTGGRALHGALRALVISLDVPAVADRARLVAWWTTGQTFVGGGGGGGGGTLPPAPPATTMITPEDHGAMGDGVIDDTEPLALAFAEADVTGRPLLLAHTYRITSRILVGSGITITGAGTIYADGPISGAAIDIHLPPLGVHPIAEVDNAATFDFSNGTGVASAVARLRVSDAAAAAVPLGAVVKVISDDETAGVEPGKGRGEFGRVQAKASAGGGNTWLYLTGRLRETFATTPRLAVLDADQRVRVEGVTFAGNFAAGVAGNWNFALLRIVGAVAPLVQGATFRDGNGRGLEYKSCVGHRTIGCGFRRFRNAVTSAGVPGYGLQDGGSAYGVHTGLHVQDCRHGYTTVHYTKVEADPFTYGRSYGHRISDSSGIGCSGGTFDTHSDAENVTFSNCVSSAPYYGETAFHGGFQLRGSRNRCVNCIARGGAFGFQSYKQFEGEGTDHVFDGCEYDGAGEAFRTDRNASIAHGADTHRATVRSPIFRTTGPRLMRLRDATVRFTDIDFRSGGTDASVRAIELRDEGEVHLTVDRGLWDLTAATGTGGRFVQYFGPDCKVDIRDVEVRVGNKQWQAVVYQASATHHIDAHFEVRVDVNPENRSGVFNATADSVVSGEVLTDHGREAHSAWLFTTISISDADVTVDPRPRSSPVVHQRVRGVVAPARVTRIEPGAVLNQLLTITNEHDAPEPVVLVHDVAANIAVGANIAIAPGAGATLIWNGVHWIGAMPVAA